MGKVFSMPRMKSSTRIIAIIVGVLGALYLLNFGVGIIEVIPDNIPIIGNLDEGFVTILMLWGLRAVGVNLQAIFPGE